MPKSLNHFDYAQVHVRDGLVGVYLAGVNDEDGVPAAVYLTPEQASKLAKLIAGAAGMQTKWTTQSLSRFT